MQMVLNWLSEPESVGRESWRGKECVCYVCKCAYDVSVRELIAMKIEESKETFLTHTHTHTHTLYLSLPLSRSRSNPPLSLSLSLSLARSLSLSLSLALSRSLTSTHTSPARRGQGGHGLTLRHHQALRTGRARATRCAWGGERTAAQAGFFLGGGGLLHF